MQWEEANQRYLLAALALVRCALEEHCARLNDQGTSHLSEEELRQNMSEAARALPAPSTLDRLSAALALSTFERNLLLMCAGVELDSEFRGLCARASGQQTSDLSAAPVPPTLSLALAA